VSTKKITVRNREEEVPEGDLNLEAWKKYRRAFVDYHSEKKIYTFENGISVKLPFPNLVNYCEEHGISESEVILAQEAATKCRKKLAELTNLKKVAYVPVGMTPRQLKNHTTLLKENETLIANNYRFIREDILSLTIGCHKILKSEIETISFEILVLLA
jgi:hypothetical protein